MLFRSFAAQSVLLLLCFSIAVGNAMAAAGNASALSLLLLQKQWRSPQIISNDNVSASSPQIAIDTAGNVMAVWQQKGSSYVYNIWAACYASGSGWAAPQLIANNAGSAENPQIAVDAAGNAFAAVWRQSGTVDGANLWAARYAFGSGWTAPQLLENDNAQYPVNPRIAVDAAGNAMTVWEQFDSSLDGSLWNISAARYVSGSGWTAPQLLENDNAGDAFSPRIAADAAGNVMAVWMQNDGSRWNISAARYASGSGWTAPQLIEDNAGTALFPQIAVDAAGNAIAVWKQSGGSSYNIWSARYVLGSGWTAPQFLAAGDAWQPQIAVDAAGNAFAVWGRSDGIWAARYVSGSGWTAPKLIADGSFASPDLAVDAAGNAIVVWQQSDGTYSQLWAARYTFGGWTAPQRIADYAEQPQVVFDAAGNAIAVWQQSGTIWAARYE